jgi:hypothetical protein
MTRNWTSRSYRSEARNSGRSTSAWSWKALPEYPPSANTTPGTWCVTVHGGATAGSCSCVTLSLSTLDALRREYGRIFHSRRSDDDQPEGTMSTDQALPLMRTSPSISQ